MGEGESNARTTRRIRGPRDGKVGNGCRVGLASSLGCLVELYVPMIAAVHQISAPTLSTSHLPLSIFSTTFLILHSAKVYASLLLARAWLLHRAAAAAMAGRRWLNSKRRSSIPSASASPPTSSSLPTRVSKAEAARYRVPTSFSSSLVSAPVSAWTVPSHRHAVIPAYLSYRLPTSSIRSSRTR